MFVGKLSLQPAKGVQLIFKRCYLSKIFGCGCFGKKEDSKLPPALTKDSKIVTKGMCMPIIGFGTWQLKSEDVKNALTCAIEQGYRHIDTAFVYGNEQEIGETLRCLFEAGKITRDQLFISSKVPFYGMEPEAVNEFLSKTLCNLGLDYLDLYMIHYPVGMKFTEKGSFPDTHTNHIAIWREMENQVDLGKIKSLGLSNFNIRQVKNILEFARYLPANLQMEMHLYCQEKDMRKFCKQHRIAVTAYAPLGSPSLDCYIRTLGLHSNGVPRPLDNPSVKKIADWHKKCQSQILLRHLIQLGGVAVIPKSSCSDRIMKNIDLFDFCLEHCEMEEMNAQDMGEKGRMFGCNLWVGTENHTEYPFGLERSK